MKASNLAMAAALSWTLLQTGCSDSPSTSQATPPAPTASAPAPAGDDPFLADNAKKEGVKVTASGLQYKVLREGTGKTPGPADTVVTHYRGTLVDGKEFDNSYKRGEPAAFPVNAVIPGWTEALQLMKVGAKYQLFIPGRLAYGPNGMPPAGIGPNATLIFEVELLEVK